MGIFRNTVLPDDDTVLEAAREALTHPADSSFCDGDLFVTWGLTVGMTRDSDLAETSNFERVSEDMARVFPADVRTVHAGHWGYGWTDQLAVRVLEPWADPYEFTARDVTRAFRVIVSVASYLREQYPLYDDSDYFRREAEARGEARRELWADVKHALWFAYDVEEEDVTDADREVFDEMWEQTEESWLPRDEVAARIMAAREERS
jgi:hypothetical protein